MGEEQKVWKSFVSLSGEAVVVLAEEGRSRKFGVVAAAGLVGLVGDEPRKGVGVGGTFRFALLVARRAGEESSDGRDGER